ncbi:6198_t:CDS:2 [Diversispora eburnea]|uniref:6198_t:CDS:1 n=1 Tax=Diversispora eburnea TaxID=1213867 RepID=A0A9N9CER9_9GLOM|nr:6198_t:CDS:2 [Diversispora eburnea]
MHLENDIRVVGFAFAHVSDNESFIKTESNEPNMLTRSWERLFKTPTILLYDNEYSDVVDWGSFAKNQTQQGKLNIVDRFKLHLGKLPDDRKPTLPEKLHKKKDQRHKRAITDYLRKMGEVNIKWERNDNELQDKRTMRECAYLAGLIGTLDSETLQFTSEPEAAAIYCFTKKSLREFYSGDKKGFMIVDCGGGTVDLTTREFINENELDEITVRSGDFCGSSFIDQDFLKYMEGIWGKSVMNNLGDCYKQRMIQKFCEVIKFPFTDKFPDSTFELDLSEFKKILSKIPGIDLNPINESEWSVILEYDTVKKMFDEQVDKIIQMIHKQLRDSGEKCSTIFLVGGFSESEYLQNRVKKEFETMVTHFSIPMDPIAAVVRGAVIYGLRMNLIKSSTIDPSKIKPIIQNRRLKYTYGVKTSSFVEGKEDDEKSTIKLTQKFSCIGDARVGTSVKVDQEFEEIYSPFFPWQDAIKIQIYTTQKLDVKTCDEPGVELLGELEVELPDLISPLLLLTKRPVLFSLTFAKEEIKAKAKNLLDRTSGTS